MPLRAAMVAYPAVIILIMAFKARSTTTKFIKAGAVSQDTARKPGSLGLMWPEPIQMAVKSGVLKPASDGRYYIDLPTHRKRRNRLIAVFVIISLALAAGMFLLWRAGF